ncbi:MAG: helix-turn-helix domain-containing protein [Candidatus Dormibacteria bacterium]
MLAHGRTPSPRRRRAAEVPVAVAGDELMTITETMQLLRLRSRATIYALMSRGELSYRRVGAHRRIWRSAAVAYVESSAAGRRR